MSASIREDLSIHFQSHAGGGDGGCVYLSTSSTDCQLNAVHADDLITIREKYE